MEGDEFGVPAGWYPDPLGLPQLRWWDSQAWTEFTSEARAPMIVQPVAETASATQTVGAGASTTAASAAAGGADDFFASATRTATAEEPLISRREQRERERRERLAADDFLVDSRSDSEEYVFAESKPATDARFTASDRFADGFADPAVADPTPEVQSSPLLDEVGATPLLATTLRELEAPIAESLETAAASPRSASMHANAMPSASSLDAIELETAAPERELHTKRTYTVASWIIALLWLIQLGAAATVIFLFNEGHNTALIWLIWAGAYLVSVGIASYDRLVLQSWGHAKPASAWWALFSPPVYLLMRLLRTFKETGKGFGLLAGAFISGVVVVAANLVLPAFLLSSLPGYFADEAASTAERTAALLGVEMTVECPAAALPLIPGTWFECVGTTPNGTTETVRLMLERQNLWIGWSVESVGAWEINAG